MTLTVCSVHFKDILLRVSHISGIITINEMYSLFHILIIMKAHSLTITKIFSIITLSLYFVQCASTSEQVSRGSLSEAVEKSSDTYKDERRVADSHKRRGSDDEESVLGSIIMAFFNNDEDDDCCYHCHFKSRNKDRDIGKGWIGFSLFTSIYYSRHYTQNFGANLRFSYQPDFTMNHSLELGLGFFNPSIDSPLYTSIHSRPTLSLGYQFQYYITPYTVPARFFLSAGLTGRLMLWKYNNPIYTDLYDESGAFIETETINRDGILCVSPSIGTGVTFNDNNRISPSLGVQFGVTLFPWETIKSFTNDMFTWDMFIKVYVSFAFGSHE